MMGHISLFQLQQLIVEIHRHVLKVGLGSCYVRGANFLNDFSHNRLTFSIYLFIQLYESTLFLSSYLYISSVYSLIQTIEHLLFNMKKHTDITLKSIFLCTNMA